MPDNTGIDVAIAFDGKRYGHWQRVSIRSTIDDLCATVNLTVTIPEIDEALDVSPSTVIRRTPACVP